MLSTEHYQTLKEMASLDEKNLCFQRKIQEEKQRISKIKSLKEEKLKEKLDTLEQGKRLKEDIANSENKYNDYQEKLKKKKSQLKLVKNERQLNSIQSEIESLHSLIEEIEPFILQKYEEFENLNEEIMNQEEFFKNIDATIRDISTDAQKKILKLSEKLKSSTERQDYLLREFPQSINSKISRIRNKKITPFISKIQNQSCSLCGMGIPSKIISTIENFISIEVCSGCQRILIPDF